VLARVADDGEAELVLGAGGELDGLDVGMDQIARVAHARRAAVVQRADGGW